MIGVHGGRADAALLRELEQARGLALGFAELAGEGEPGREHRRAAGLLVVQAERRSAITHLRQALADALTGAARVVEASARAAGAHAARLVVHVLFERHDRGLAIARARIEPAPRLVEVARAQEARGLVLGERERTLRHREGVLQRVGGEGALRGACPVVRGLLVLPAEVVVTRDDRGVLAHRGQPGGGERVELLALALTERGISDLAHERVLEQPLPGPGEASDVLLDQDLGADQEL